MKKILVVGAGRGQVGLIKAAKKLGYYTIAASIDGDYPGFKLADEKYIADISNPEAIAAAATELKVDGVVTAGMDLPLPALGLACERNGLPGLTAETARVSANKLLMKDAFLREGVSTAKYVKVSTEIEARNAINKIELPVIVKPVDLGGSRGINIVFDEKDIVDAFNNTMQATKEDYCIIEEYIDGCEISATALVADEKVLFVLPMADVRYGENAEVPIGHYVPLDCDEDIAKQTVREVSKAIKALALNNCAINADLMVYKNKVYILELTGRLGANAIPEITSAYYDWDIHEQIVEISLGHYDKVKSFDYNKHSNKVCFGQMIISEEDGILEKASLGTNYDEWFFLKEGDKVRKFHNPGDCVGQIFIEGNSVRECEDTIKEALKGLLVK